MARSLHNLVIHRVMDRQLRDAAAQYASGRLLDIGCGTKPYEDLFRPYVEEHVGLDREQPFNSQARVDVVGVADDMPIPDGSFDCAVSTAALEHLTEPEAALRECHRVLRPDGMAIYTVPLIWHLHGEPWDYYRFTNHGLRHLFEKTGFEIVELRALSGFWLTMGQMLSYYIIRFQRGPLRRVPLGYVTLPIQFLAQLLDRVDKAEEWTWMYLVVARKK